MSTDLISLRKIEARIKSYFNKVPFNKILNHRGGYSKIRNVTVDENGNIIALQISNKKFTDFPLPVLEMPKLKLLVLIYTNITELPAGISALKDLEYLNLGRNRLNSLPPSIGMLKNLKKLALWRNPFQEFPLEILALPGLEILSLANCGIRSIPGRINELRSLKSLHLENNNLQAIPPELGDLKTVKKITLDDNKITTIPPNILNGSWKLFADSSNGDGISLAGNPLKDPPLEILKKSAVALREYLKSRTGAEEKTLNEVKVLLVGDGGAGKTSLLLRLMEDDFDPAQPQTHGINIRDWQTENSEKPIIAHFWDFGGQSIMHATHQIFLSRRSLYILVLDGRKEEQVEYWLKHIESFGGDSPILVVLNKTDQNPAFDLNRKFLLEKYPSIKGFFPLSCASGSGIEEFSKALTREMAQVEILETVWAKSWFQVKTALENMKSPYISAEQYNNLCEKANIDKKSAKETLIDFLNDLGIILHFRDFDLTNLYVLNPRWVTQAIYRIINSKILAASRGILDLTLLKEILAPRDGEDYLYPENTYSYIITIMKKFELCYELDQKKVLIPDLLEVQEPETLFFREKSLKFFIQYDFLPRSVMPQFIVKMHKDIDDSLRWRTGVVLKDRTHNTRALVKADQEAKRIYIYINGPRRRDYFAVILYFLREINSSFEKIKCTEKVPMPDDEEVSVSYRHLLKLAERGIETYIPDGAENEYNVAELLGTLEVKENDEEILQILKTILEKMDNKESTAALANKIIDIKPNFMGVGININAIVEKLLKKPQAPE